MLSDKVLEELLLGYWFTTKNAKPVKKFSKPDKLYKIQKQLNNMKKGKRDLQLLLFIFIILLTINFISSAAIGEDLHLNIQTTNSTGVVTGTFDFEFNISTSSDCANVIYNNYTNLTTDSRGIISYYLENVVLNFSEQYWLCYYRNDVLINSSKIARTPYTYRARNVTLSGVEIDSDLNMGGYNASFNGGWQNGGVSILGGGIFAQVLHVYNITSLNVNTLNINGSILPTIGWDNMFDIGSSSLRWRDLYLSGQINSNGTGNNYFLGNVGINTTSPSEKLEIESGGIRVGYTSDTYDDLITFRRNNVEIGAIDNLANNIRLFAKNNKDLSLTDDSGNGITIKDGGNVKIGETNLTDKLVVVGNLTIGNENTSINPRLRIFGYEAGQPLRELNIEFADATVGWKFNSLYSKGFDFRQSGTSRLAIEVSTGDIGIGRMYPTYKFDVNGNVSLNNTLYVLNSGNVGIGTASPTQKLDVNGSVNISNDLWVNGVNITANLGSSTNHTNITFNTFNSTWDNNWLTALLSANDTALNTSIKLALAINSTAGLVYGINTTPNIGNLYNATALLYAQLVNSSLNTQNLYNTTLFQHVFFNRSGTNLFLRYTGDNVGIGTMTPGQKLDVNGTVQLTNLIFRNPGIGNDTRLTFTKTSDYAWISVNETLSDQTRFAFEMSDNPDTTTDRFVWYISDYKGGGGDWEPLNFNNLGVNLRGADVNAYGNYNIYGPWYSGGGQPNTVSENKTGTLTVTPTVRNFTGTYRLYGIEIDGTGSPNTFKWFNNSAWNGVPSATNVEITGTQQTLDSGVNITFSAITGGALGDRYQFRVYKGGRILAGNGSSIAPTFSFTGDTNTGIYSGGVDNLRFTTGGADRITIDTSGYVGIGTASPQTKLDIRNNSQVRNEAAYQANADAPIVYWGFVNNQDDNGRTKGWLWNIESNVHVGEAKGGRLTLSEYTGWDSATPYAIPTANLSNLMTFYNGNVGIGTTNPNQKLQVNGTANVSNDLWVNGMNVTANLGSSGGALPIWINDSFSVYNNLSYPSYLNLSGIMYVNKTSGYVGIGTTSPTNWLTIAINDATGTEQGITIKNTDTTSSTSDPTLTLFRSSSVKGAIVYDGSGGDLWIKNYYANANGDIRFYANGAERMAILGDGKVGIGTPSPLKTLSVVGTINQTACVSAGTLSTNTAGDIICTSDERLKDIHNMYSGGLEVIKEINPIVYNLKNETYVRIGFSAQNVQKVLPEATAVQINGMLSLDQAPIIAALVNSVKELEQQNADLTKALCEIKPELELCK